MDLSNSKYEPDCKFENYKASKNVDYFSIKDFLINVLGGFKI